MSIREIVKYGDPRLVAANAAVTEFGAEGLSSLIRDLLDTCWRAPGYGLAAPQIGVNLQVAVVDLSVGEDPAQIITLINPVLREARGRIRDEEGCLSFPDIVEIIERPEEVMVEAADLTGTVRTYEARDLLARAFCHEIDHLEARLFIERMSPLKRSFALRRVIKRQRKGTW